MSYDHVVVKRAALFWLHLILGLAAALMYLSTIDTTHLRWWRPRAGDIALLRSSAPLVPYLVSGVFSRRLVTDRRFGLWLFALILMVGTAVVGHFYLTRTVDEASAVGIFTAILIQTVVYVLAARVLLGGKIDE